VELCAYWTNAQTQGAILVFVPGVVVLGCGGKRGARIHHKHGSEFPQSSFFKTYF